MQQASHQLRSIDILTTVLLSLYTYIFCYPTSSSTYLQQVRTTSLVGLCTILLLLFNLRVTFRRFQSQLVTREYCDDYYHDITPTFLNVIPSIHEQAIDEDAPTPASGSLSAVLLWSSAVVVIVIILIATGGTAGGGAAGPAGLAAAAIAPANLGAAASASALGASAATSSGATAVLTAVGSSTAVQIGAVAGLATATVAVMESSTPPVVALSEFVRLRRLLDSLDIAAEYRPIVMELFGLSDLSIINSQIFRYSIYADEGQAGLVLRIVDPTGLDGWVVEIPREFLTDAIRSAFQERTNVIMQIAADRLLSLEIANYKAASVRQATQETERLLKKINEGGLGELLIEYARMELANMGVAGYTLIGAALVGVTLFGWAAAGRPGLRPLRSWLIGGTLPKRPAA